ncbi:transcriptional regulator [Pseudomonas sp. MWU13-2860]|nr:transcriptional regulator [Pseudomonas sp. MWU13-2860]
MNIRPIHTDQDYCAALKSVSPLFDNEPQPGTPEGDYFDVMITLIQAYETREFPRNLPNPIETPKLRIEQPRLSASDLAPAIARTNRVYEVINGKRALTLPTIWKHHQLIGIPAESLIKPIKSS